MTQFLNLFLPYPPSVNSYWGFHGSHRYLTPKAREFKKEVYVRYKESGHQGFDTSRLTVSIELHAKDKRARDIDNILKSLLDALGQAGVYVDDSQIDVLIIKRGENLKDGGCNVKIEEIL